MPDRYAGTATGLDAPASFGFAITPHDSNELEETVRGLYVGGTGNIVLVTSGGDELTFVNVGAGSILPVRALIVKATDTTATSLVGLV